MTRASVVKKQLMKEIEGLSEERLKVLTDLAAFLKEREEWEETMEILANKELTEAIEASRKAWKEGRHEEFIPFSTGKGN
ncbi:MAG: hypothetical protein HW384_987 [Dehalococcoidia bacterium]|nr:hypothetical protein [Dehalococcoidia bacterium]